MNNKLIAQIRIKIGELRNERFENFVNDILRLEYSNFGFLETMVNKQGNQRKSKPDAHILIQSDTAENPQYIVFNHTIEGRAKIIKDIKETTSGKTPINCIKKYVACTNNPVGEDREEYREMVKKYNWDFEIYSLDALTKLSIKYKIVLNDHLNIDYEDLHYSKTFNCGHRLKVLRIERGLKKSQFIEFISIKSEKELENIENNL